MTVIAANLTQMSADSLVQIDGNGSYFAPKIFRLADGSVVGVAGNGTGGEMLLDWLQQGELRGNEPHFVNPCFIAMRLKPDGLWLYNDTCIPERIRSKVFAIGSGCDVALYVMRVLKKTPAVAVREAMKIDRNCGGSIDTLTLSRKKKKT